MQLERQLVSKKELKTLGIPYSFQHIARLEAASIMSILGRDFGYRQASWHGKPSNPGVLPRRPRRVGDA